MIRRATRDDVRTLFRDGQWFVERSAPPGGYDPRVFLRFLVEQIEDPSFLFLIGDRGGTLAAVFSPSWYGPGVHGVEMWLRGRGDAGRLVAAYEAEAQARGAGAVAATAQIEHDGPRVARALYERRGYRQRELLLVKDL